MTTIVTPPTLATATRLAAAAAERFAEASDAERVGRGVRVVDAVDGPGRALSVIELELDNIAEQLAAIRGLYGAPATAVAEASVENIGTWIERTRQAVGDLTDELVGRLHAQRKENDAALARGAEFVNEVVEDLHRTQSEVIEVGEQLITICRKGKKRVPPRVRGIIRNAGEPRDWEQVD